MRQDNALARIIDDKILFVLIVGRDRHCVGAARRAAEYQDLVLTVRQGAVSCRQRMRRTRQGDRTDAVGQAVDDLKVGVRGLSPRARLLTVGDELNAGIGGVCTGHSSSLRRDFSPCSASRGVYLCIDGSGIWDNPSPH